MLQRRLVGGQRNIYGENKFGDEMKSSVSIYLRREDVGGCKLWEVGSTKDNYLDTKRKAFHAVCRAKKNTEKEQSASVKDNTENICRITKQMHTESQAVIGEICIRGDDGNLSLITPHRN